MRIEGKHPRKPQWVHYRCDECGETFWSGPPLTELRDRKDRCEGCVRAPNLHFTPGNAKGNPRSDTAFHGGEFTKGEW